jgi:hypothetical protein
MRVYLMPRLGLIFELPNPPKTKSETLTDQAAPTVDGSFAAFQQSSKYRTLVQTNKSVKIAKIPICAASQQKGRTPGGAKA